MNKRPVIAIGLDAADAQIIEKWMAAGYLKNLHRIRQEGVYGRLNNTTKYCGISTESIVTEVLWAGFSTGCKSDKTGYWDSIKFHPDQYRIECDMRYCGYDHKEYPPFYALGDRYRVATFDVPVSVLSEQVNGVQILGWGGHYPMTPSCSRPLELLPNIIHKYGENPVLFKDDSVWWDKPYIAWLQKALETSIANRSAICRDLLKQEPWDLFLAVFGEPHTAGHDIYNYSQSDHPLYPYLSQNGTAPDPLLATYQQIDQAIGEILAEASEDAYILCFALHGTGPNYSDMPSAAFLPELLYRYNFPGKVAIAPGKIGVVPPPMITQPIRNSWLGEVWSKNYHPNPVLRWLRPWIPSRFLRSSLNGLVSPYVLMDQSVDMGWMPARWYQPLWPQMKAFAIPSFAQGHIRINLQGREPQGIVQYAEYERICDELVQMLNRLQDGRTGAPLVKKVIRTRSSADENDPKLPDSDLVVIWQEHVTDVVDSPDFGRIGPLTHFRAGTHREQGFLLAKGPGIASGSDLLPGESIDIPPTILALMGADIPDYFDGHPLLETSLVNSST